MALIGNVIFFASSAYFLAAILNYYLCIKNLFRHRARWDTFNEVFIYFLVVVLSGIIDVWVTGTLIDIGVSIINSKSIACISSLAGNFIGAGILFSLNLHWDRGNFNSQIPPTVCFAFNPRSTVPK